MLPLADAGVAERDVPAWWKRRPFDFAIPARAGNRTLCFLEGRAELPRLIRENPGAADWWIARERRVSNRTNARGRACAGMKRFRFDETCEEPRAAAFGRGDPFDDAADTEAFDRHRTDRAFRSRAASASVETSPAVASSRAASRHDHIGSFREATMREVRLRDAKATLSALVEKATRGESSVITRRGKPRAVLLGIEEWDRLRRVPSFGRLLLSAPLEEADLPPRDATPMRDTTL